MILCILYMFQVSEFNKIVAEFADKPVDFMMIYIEEVHPSDGFDVKENEFKVIQHKSVEERIAAAKAFAENAGIKCLMLVDSMSNEATALYGAFPDRLYIIRNDVIEFVGGMGPMFYNVSKMVKALKTLL
ncbi:unnamed protein product [Clavelina lepadiformis]|uniref:Iodothyronine deiodinase n=1 Tax=Clavelina lepadiformis TaxID=159417 RepID=A0ABP0GJM9_CLALP